MNSQNTRPAPLDGIKIVDLSRVLAGPWASQALADMGAEVIKIERPEWGDDTRQWGPPFLKTAEGAPTQESAYFMCTNRNKSSITVDIAQTEGQDIVRALAGRADVFLENFKVGALSAYRLDAESLRAINPRLIYCSITGFGQDGPYASRAGYDAMIQAMSGHMSITGKSDGEEGGGPQKIGVALIDVMTGLYASMGILAALRERDRSGLGQCIDVALLDVAVATLANQAANYLMGGEVPQRRGNAHPSIVPYQDFPTVDGDIMVAVGNDKQFHQFCAVLGQSEWASETRFATNAQRVANRATLIPLLQQRLLSDTTKNWLARFDKVGVPCGPINQLDEVFADPQVQARGMAINLSHPLAGPVPLVANPIHLSHSPLVYRHAPPLLGEHTDMILADELNFSAEKIAQLRRDKVV